MKPPPWIHTITGLPCPGVDVGVSGSEGVQTFSERQSSLCGSVAPGSEGAVIPGIAADCGAMAPKVEASLTSSQASAARGGRQRSLPTGALP